MGKNIGTQPLGNYKVQQKQSMFKKVVITTCVGMGITIGSVVYADSIDSNLPTVYHVYLDGKYVGTVDQKSVVKKYVEDQIDESSDDFDNLQLVVGQEISYIPETVFRPTYNNRSVLTALESQMSVQANAVKLEVGGELVGYLATKEDVESALKKILEKYVPDNVVSQFNISQLSSDILSVVDSSTLDVSFSKKVSLSEEKVVPSDILTVEQAVKLLLKGTLTDKVHTIQSGEVLGQIAEKYDLSVKTLEDLNPGITEESILQIGAKVNVTGYDSYVNVVTEEKIKETVNIPYETIVKETSDLYKGQTRIQQAGVNGKKEVSYSLKKENGQVVEKEMIEEKIISNPTEKIVLKGTKVSPSRGTGNFSWPTVGGRITSPMGARWGSYHRGIDISGVSDRTIKAADNGTVSYAGWDGTYGNKVVINHNNGFRTVYAHLSRINVNVGQTVPRGASIGVMGTTGRSTGVHLHFEVLKNGSNVNPLNYTSR
ncbi:M23 family metallopeptidase [Bacillaceae bacterium S4-13-58]